MVDLGRGGQHPDTLWECRARGQGPTMVAKMVVISLLEGKALNWAKL